MNNVSNCCSAAATRPCNTLFKCAGIEYTKQRFMQPGNRMYAVHFSTAEPATAAARSCCCCCCCRKRLAATACVVLHHMHDAGPGCSKVAPSTPDKLPAATKHSTTEGACAPSCLASRSTILHALQTQALLRHTLCIHSMHHLFGQDEAQCPGCPHLWQLPLPPPPPPPPPKLPPRPPP